MKLPSLILAFSVAFILLAGCTGSSGANLVPEGEEPIGRKPPETHGNYGLAASERGYYLGMVPTPETVPEVDLFGAYEEAGEICEVVGIWPEPSAIGAYASLEGSRTVEGVRVYGLKPIVNMNFYTFERVEGEGLKIVVNSPEEIPANLSDPAFRDGYVNDARRIAERFQPEYLSLGNEVNAYYAAYPEDFGDYISLYKEAYDAVKGVSPETKVFVVFSLNQMDALGQWGLISRFEGKADLVAFTTYPWKEYETPGEIPEDYYSRLAEYTDKPVAFAETGWPSDESVGASEEEQAEYLARFVELTDGMDVEFVNWLFLHDVEVSGDMASISSPATGTIALKKNDGRPKDVYYVWLDLHDVPLSR